MKRSVVTLSAKANFRVLGPRLGKNMKAAAKEIAGLSSEEIRSLREGHAITLELDGAGPLELTVDDILIQREEKEDMPVANEGDITVALVLHRDKKLVREGLAREIVHVIQNIRKEKGLDVSDRITVTYSLSGNSMKNKKALVRVFKKFGDYIMGETLCTTLECKDEVEGDAVDIEGHTVMFDIKVVG